MKHRALVVALLVGLAAAAARPDQRWIYVLPQDGSGVLAVDATGQVREIQLSRTGAAGIYPTPGGKFVFVRHEGSTDLSVIDAELLSEHGTVSMPEVPDGLAFAPTGEKVYITLAKSSSVLVFDHKRALLTARAVRDLGSPGAPLLLNRRGTRLYRSGGRGLGFYVESTGEIIRSVQPGAGEGTWAFSLDYRQIWGVPLAGGPATVIDERSGSVTRTLPGPFAAVRPLFSRDGSKVLLSAASRERILVVSSRTLREESSIAFPEHIEGLAAGDGDAIWVLSGKQLHRLDLAPGRVSLTVTLPRAGRALAAVVLRPGEGFACF